MVMEQSIHLLVTDPSSTQVGNDRNFKDIKAKNKRPLGSFRLTSYITQASNKLLSFLGSAVAYFVLALILNSRLSRAGLSPAQDLCGCARVPFSTGNISTETISPPCLGTRMCDVVDSGLNCS